MSIEYKVKLTAHLVGLQAYCLDKLKESGFYYTLRGNKIDNSDQGVLEEVIKRWIIDNYEKVLNLTHGSIEEARKLGYIPIRKKKR